MNIIIEEIVLNPLIQIEETITEVIIEVSEMQVPGPQGIQGPQGLKGDTGANGVVDYTNIVQNIVKEATRGANVTGTVSETILYSKLIPANTFKDGDFMNLFSRVAKVGQIATLTQRVKINTSNTLTGAKLISTNLLGFANKFGNTIRTFTLYNGNILGFSFATALVSDYLNSNIATESTAFDTTVDNYIFITGQLSESADTMYHLGTKITN